jgi:integrase
MKLTQASIARLALPAGKSEAIFFDDDLPGFGLRIREGGSRTFVVQYALGGRQRRMTIGSAKVAQDGGGLLTAAKARETAGNLLAKVRLGQDPAGDRAEARVRAADELLGDVVGRFLARQERRLRPRSYIDTKRYLEQYWKPLHGFHVARISRATVAARVSKIADLHGPVSADRARAALSAFFAWVIGEGLCDMNPVIGTNKHFDGAKSRDRVLADRQLAIIWRALPDSDYGDIVKLLVLTGQRREEIGGLRWAEIDFETRAITLPPDRTKNGRPHEVPLSKPALAILKSRERRAGRDFVFGDGPRQPNGADEERAGGFQGWSKCKTALDTRTATIGAWRLHDVRRTVATRMAELGVQPHVVEAVLNHISGHKAGVAGIYNRSSYAAEKRAALELWGKHVQSLTAVDKTDGQRVVKFPAGATKR